MRTNFYHKSGNSLNSVDIHEYLWKLVNFRGFGEMKYFIQQNLFIFSLRKLDFNFDIVLPEECIIDKILLIKWWTAMFTLIRHNASVHQNIAAIEMDIITQLSNDEWNIVWYDIMWAMYSHSHLIYCVDFILFLCFFPTFDFVLDYLFLV